MNKTQHQNSIKTLADMTWATLVDVLNVNDRGRPPVYFFLSPESKGSLKGRSLYEIDLVHRQQFYGEGITLKFPPCAWVSRLDQTPEETGHLFALSYQKSTLRFARRAELTAPQELWSMTLHECFGQFAAQLTLGLTAVPPRPKKRVVDSQGLWEAAHREGYFLGRELTEAYLDERISLPQIQKWFGMNWYSANKPIALDFLYRLLKKTAPTSDFKKVF